MGRKRTRRNDDQRVSKRKRKRVSKGYGTQQKPASKQISKVQGGLKGMLPRSMAQVDNSVLLRLVFLVMTHFGLWLKIIKHGPIRVD